MKIVVFGANGPTGRHLIQQVSGAGHQAVAVTRNPQTFPGLGATVVQADVFQPRAVAECLNGADAVLSVLGVPFSRQPVDTFSTGTSNIVAAMRSAGLRRLVAVSSTGAHHYRDRVDASLALKLIEPILSRTIGKTVYDDLRRMEEIVADSELDWTVVRPSTLFNAHHVSDYTAGQVPPVGAFTARIDLAHYVSSIVGDASTYRSTPIVSTTEAAPTFWQNMRNEISKSR